MAVKHLNIVKLDGIGDAIIFLAAAKQAGVCLNSHNAVFFVRQHTAEFLSELLPLARVRVVPSNIVLQIVTALRYRKYSRNSVTAVCVRSDIPGKFNKRLALLLGSPTFLMEGFFYRNPIKNYANKFVRSLTGRTIASGYSSEFTSYLHFFDALKQIYTFQEPCKDDNVRISAASGAIIFPGASNDDKRYPINRYIQVYFSLKERNVPVKFILGPSESNLFGILAESHVEIEDIKTGLTPSQVIQQICDSKVVVANDSMAAHLAAYLNTRLICLTWGVRFERFLGYLENKNVCLRVACEFFNCENCHYLGSKKYFCINKLDSSVVSEAVWSELYA